MTTTQHLNKHFETSALIKRMLIGGTIGLVLMSIFLLGAPSRPEWGKYWTVRPLVIMLLGAAAGGGCTYFMDLFFGYLDGWKRLFVKVITILGFIISLYLSSVLGLAGTLWN